MTTLSLQLPEKEDLLKKQQRGTMGKKKRSELFVDYESSCAMLLVIFYTVFSFL